MPRRLYYEDVNLQQFAATVTAVREEEGRCHVALDQTAFYPEGGGQPGDTGILFPPEGPIRAGEQCIVTNTKELDGEIWHIIYGSLRVGDEVRGQLNWALRLHWMQQHLGQHILSALVKACYDGNTVGVHFGREQSAVDFDCPLTDREVTELEESAAAVVTRNLPVEILYPSPEEIAARARRPAPDTAEPIRMSDFENLKYLPNLQSLGIQYIDDAVTSINLVNNPKLFSVFLGEGANVASIKIASSSTRISSDIGIYNMPKLTSFDVSEFPGLEYISQLDLCPLLKTLDLRNNHNICAVEFYEPSGVETILFEGEYVNEFALNDMGNIKLTSLDLSKAKIKFRMPLLESMEHYGTTHNENPSGHNLSSFIFPATKGDVVMSKLYLINTKLRKLDVTNVVSSQGELIVVQNPLLLHLAIDPRGSSFTYAEICENNMGNGITIYLPDEVYDMLQSTGDLNVQGIYDVYKFLIADLSDSDVTWARYSTYAAATAGID